MRKHFPIAISDSRPSLTNWDIENKLLTIRTEEFCNDIDPNTGYYITKAVTVIVKNWKSIWIYVFRVNALHPVESNNINGNDFSINCIFTIDFDEDNALEIIGDAENISSLIYKFEDPEIEFIYPAIT